MIHIDSLEKKSWFSIFFRLFSSKFAFLSIKWDTKKAQTSINFGRINVIFGKLLGLKVFRIKYLCFESKCLFFLLLEKQWPTVDRSAHRKGNRRKEMFEGTWASFSVKFLLRFRSVKSWFIESIFWVVFSPRAKLKLDQPTTFKIINVNIQKK